MTRQSAISPTRDHEHQLRERGYNHIVGMDEVGRGCLAGPVTVAAVILPDTTNLEGVRDSKLVSRLRRGPLAAAIKAQALAVGIGWADAREIDQLGLMAALGLAGGRALGDLDYAYGAVILDGSYNYLDTSVPVETITGADRCCLAVAAASIVAKVARDNYMHRAHQRYPAFGFNRHVGYGTAAHLESLATGVSPLHRASFAPVRRALEAGGVD